MLDQKETTANRYGKFIVFGILFVALVGCIVLSLSKLNNNKSVEVSENNATVSALERGFVDEKNADDIMIEMSDKVEKGMFECKMTTTWTFENSDSVSPNAYVANVESNLHTLYFDVFESATNELLYSSPMLPVGTELNDIKLDKKLSAGDYSAVVMYTLVDENYEEVSTVGFNITISIIH